MRSFNMNLVQAVSIAVAAGELTVEELNAGIEEARGLNYPCGAARDQHGHFYSLFVSTDKETKKVNRSKDGARIKFNLRANDVKKDQKAQTPGAVLPGTQGSPALNQATIQAIADLVAKQTAAPAADAPTQPEVAQEETQSLE
jgi:hypothetical protein